MGQENGTFRQVAAQQNSSISKFIRDISKFFGSQSRQQSELSNSIGDLQQTTMQTSQRVSQTNDLLQESISVQTQMLNELRSVSRGISNLLDLAGAAGGGAEGTGGGIGGFIGGLVGGAALTAGLGAAAMSMTGGLGNLTNNLSSTPVSGTTAQVLETIKTIESGGDYTTPNKEGVSSASGAYQFIDSTWKNLTQKYGIGSEYGRAMEAPPEVQDAVAAKYVEEILSQNNNDVSKVPLVWYTGNAQGKMSQEALRANGGQAAAAYQQKFLNAFQSIGGGAEKDDASAPAGTMVQQEGPMGGGAVLERQRELAGVRKLPLSARLRGVLEQAAASVGVQAVVYSGGQAPAGSGGPRTGSTRHDHGNAADLYLIKDGRKLSDTNPEDKAIMSKFVSAAVAAGATGVGAGHGYMGPTDIHVGFGQPATWGGADWIQSAAAGITNNQDLSSGGGGYQTAGGGGYGGGLDPLSSLLGANMGIMGSGLESLIGAVMGGSPMGMISGLLPAPAISGFGGMLASLTGALSGSSKQDTNQVAEIEENMPEEKIEADDSGAMIAQLKDRSSDYIQNMAVQTESIKFAAMSQQQTPTAAPQYPNIADGFRTNQDLYRTGAPSSPSWYQQLAGRISNDEAMKLRGGVLA